MNTPRIPLFLAIAGALPLVYAALLNMGLPPISELQPWLPYWDDGAGLMLVYGQIILVFMAGVLWGVCNTCNRQADPAGLCTFHCTCPLCLFLCADLTRFALRVYRCFFA